MDKVQKPSNSECYTLSSESIRVYKSFNLRTFELECQYYMLHQDFYQSLMGIIKKLRNVQKTVALRFSQNYHSD
jgi:hypothetical protein